MNGEATVFQYMADLLQILMRGRTSEVSELKADIAKSCKF